MRISGPEMRIAAAAEALHLLTVLVDILLSALENLPTLCTGLLAGLEGSGLPLCLPGLVPLGLLGQQLRNWCHFDVAP